MVDVVIIGVHIVLCISLVVSINDLDFKNVRLIIGLGCGIDSIVTCLFTFVQI